MAKNMMTRERYEHEVRAPVGRPPRSGPEDGETTSLSLREAAATLGIDVRMFRNLVTRGELPLRPIRSGNGRMRFRRREIHALTGRT